MGGPSAVGRADTQPGALPYRDSVVVILVVDDLRFLLGNVGLDDGAQGSATLGSTAAPALSVRALELVDVAVIPSHSASARLVSPAAK